ncbi:dual specificity calcium/calmodulin-dependent 3',5'-cyclic nucleotide phosphodiesterase 1-like isoform X1 [Sitodiplosis mosellana]|uniref:dual specificity calcium/calmodulin-dependent 3',5'-cyclic nucleotide phosphodiesterase 1-like isoform X1 n=1 Tax=Sitodiplosis mosellana TaxID=263140 RepID=UPI002443C966|nr:dual specificity calcium/calmodulin-dependent 3',5'-cyclic nucleotide phosphodiesterase 1-like isoform X1 [Sitodiplosis mosellana]
MDNSISDENINTVAAAAVVAASTATGAVGTPTITKSNDGSHSSCDDDGQTITHMDDNRKTKCDKAFSATGIVVNTTTATDELCTKDYALRRNDGSYKRTITSKCISRARDLVHKCQSDPGGSRVLPALNVVANRSSQTRSSFRHQSPSCSSTSPSSTAITTRKCVLTLDGYNYVIVASSPDSKSKTENLTGATSSEHELKSPFDEKSGNSEQSQISSPAPQQPSSPTINGLISIRRSSTKKSDYFTKRYSQPQLDTGLEFSYPTTTPAAAATIPTAAAPHLQSQIANSLQQIPLDVKCGLDKAASAAGNKHKPYLNRRNQLYRFSCDNCPDDYHSSSGDTTVAFGDKCKFAAAKGETFAWTKMQSDSVSSSSSVLAQNRCLTEHDGSEQAAVATNPVDLTTDNLPAVDTPDALSQASARLRCILKLLQRCSGDVSAEILQKNLHYAARVLEALYIDETKSVKNQKKISDESTAPDFESNIEIENRGECANDDDHDDVDENASVKSGNADMDVDIKTDDVPEQSVSPNNHEHSLDENDHETANAHNDLTSNDDTITAITTTTATEYESQTSISINSFGGSVFLGEQWHRRLRAPVWARQQENKIANEKKHSTADNSASTKDNDLKVQRRLADEDDELSEVQPDAVPPEVREWLASTFTRQLVTTRKRTEEKPKFRTVAHAIRAGIFVDRIYRRVSSTAMLQFPTEVVKVLKTLDDWSFDQFALATATNGQPIKYLGYDLLNRYGIIHKFKVSPTVLEQFLVKIEEGYCRYQNPYHNNLHAADVAQTIHYMLCQTGVMHYLTDLEIFAILIAALIHDYEHTGTTNSFHINTGSDMAMLYNDRAVLENHHASAAFRMLKEDEYNIFSNLSREEYKEIRNLVIDMVISTDMSFHNQQLKNMKSLIAIASSDTHYNKTNVDLKFKALSFILHCCDISHPAKKWEIHHRWTMLLIEEFFRQGDLERELGLDISPLCDRNSTVIPKSQIVFIEVIVEPSLAVCADLLELILTPIASQSGSKTDNTIAEESQKSSSPATSTDTQNPSQPQRIFIKKPWIACMKENKRIWKEQEAAEPSSQPSLSTEEQNDPDANLERPSSS